MIELNTLLDFLRSASALVYTLVFGAFPKTVRSDVASAKSLFISYYPGAGPSLGATQSVLRSTVDPKAPSLTPYDSAKVLSSYILTKLLQILELSGLFMSM